jgi:hypothetical protein
MLDDSLDAALQNVYIKNHSIFGYGKDTAKTKTGSLLLEHLLFGKLIVINISRPL